MSWTPNPSRLAKALSVNSRPTRRRRPLRSLAVVVVTPMAMVACSSSDSSEAVSTSQEPTTAAPSTTTPTSFEATLIDQSSTTTVSTKPSSTGVRYLEPTFQVDVQRDVVYGSASMPDGSGGLVELRLDLYHPGGDTESKRPVFIYSHGGSFVGGDKDEGIEWATRMAQLGYVAASIDYRVGPLAVTAPLDEQEQAQIDRARNDLQAAVRWFKANATLLGIDPDRIALGGYSAGAMMSAGAAVRSNDPASTPPVVAGSNPEFSSAVCGAVSIAGALNPAHVDPGDAGVIFHHGTLDDTVPFAAAVAARDALLNAGLPVEWHEYPGEGHGFSAASQAIIETTSIQWLYEHVATASYPCSPAVAAGVTAP
jgi:acetyl esterase/lipase